MSNTNNKQEYCQITFVYGWREGEEKVPHPILRYIPVEEMNECYFILCRDEECPNLKTHKVHPQGMPGCAGCRGHNEWNVCGSTKCDCNKWHLYGSHKKCVGSWKAKTYNKYNALPFLNKYTTTVIPEGEIVYHFNKWRFTRERKNEKFSNSKSKATMSVNNDKQEYTPNVTDALLEHSRQDDPENEKKRLEHAMRFRQAYFTCHDKNAPMANALCEIAYQKFLKGLKDNKFPEACLPPPPPY